MGNKYRAAYSKTLRKELTIYTTKILQWCRTNTSELQGGGTRKQTQFKDTNLDFSIV